MASDGRWYPPETAPGWAAAPLVQIGDIAVTADQVHTPYGNRPVGQVTWAVNDLSRTYRVIPTWAIVCAVIGFFFVFLGLLFLLVKEDRTDGIIQVTALAPGFSYTTSVPVRSTFQVADVHNRVNYARSVCAAAQQVGPTEG